MSEVLDWAIVGGGPHGVHVATRLIADAGVPRERLALLDPAPRLLDRWHRCTSNTGMTHLRSPGVHHIGVDPFGLLRYASGNTRGRGAPKGGFLSRYDRPALGLFGEHCDAVVAHYGLAGRHVRAKVHHVDLSDEVAVLTTDGGDRVRACHVVLATGSGERPCWPDWALQLRREGGKVAHVFQPGFELDPADWTGSVAVVGGGLSAAQVALRLASSGASVHLLSRHPLRQHQFDSDPGWAGPKHMRGFLATPCLKERRRVISAARHVGSLPPEVFRAMRHAIAGGEVHFLQGEPRRVSHTEPSAGVTLEVAGERLSVDGVMLATGFERSRPGGEMVDALIAQHALPCSDCGYPVVDRHLRWHPQLFVSGPLAELQIGPASRNIVGARRAAERIVAAASVA